MSKLINEHQLSFPFFSSILLQSIKVQLFIKYQSKKKINEKQDTENERRKIKMSNFCPKTTVYTLRIPLKHSNLGENHIAFIYFVKVEKEHETIKVLQTMIY